MSFEKIKNKYLITNESGKYIFSNKIKSINFKKKLEVYNYNKLNRFVYSSPTLHIIVTTLKCNLFCRYCRATKSSFSQSMNTKTAKKIIDFIFSTPSKDITIEFQGGEPLLNWDVLKESINYINEKRKNSNKDVIISIVTNLTLMVDEKLKFLIKNNISICTSLDGPKYVHDKNRLFFNGSSYEKVIYWFKKIKKIIEKSKSSKPDSLPSALMTTTRFSLPYFKEIIDEYRKIELGGIFIRPLSPIGYTKNVWNEIGYNSNDFLMFYKKALDYIITINKKGEKFIERNAAIKLKKILFSEDPNFLDLRSPCGAGIGQIAYNYNGDIYTCDEGRMVGARHDYTFKIGNVYNHSFKDIILNPKTVKCVLSSLTLLQIGCINCPYRPYCGICPVYNYEVYGNLTGKNNLGYWCEIEKGIFRIIFKKIMNKENINIFKRWFDARHCTME